MGIPSSYLTCPAYTVTQPVSVNAGMTTSVLNATASEPGFPTPSNFMTPTATPAGYNRQTHIPNLRQAWRKYMRIVDECEDRMRRAKKELDDVVDEVDRYLG